MSLLIGGETNEQYMDKTINNILNQTYTLTTNDDFIRGLEKCTDSSIREQKLKKFTKICEKYPLIDFILDMYQLPKNINNNNDNLFNIIIILIILVIIIIIHIIIMISTKI